MSEIKSFTDIQQSKKLAKILPLESADMWYLSDESLFPKINYNGMVFFNSEEEKPVTIIPCWSLTSLLGVLPMIRKGKDIARDIIIGKSGTMFNPKLVGSFMKVINQFEQIS